MREVDGYVPRLGIIAEVRSQKSEVRSQACAMVPALGGYLSSGNKKTRTAGYGLGGILFLEAYERQERARRMRAIFAACSGELSVAVRMA